jgi:hypothetical protein
MPKDLSHLQEVAPASQLEQSFGNPDKIEIALTAGTSSCNQTKISYTEIGPPVKLFF